MSTIIDQILGRDQVKTKPVIHSLIFGFAGKARSGKDTAVAEILKQSSHAYDVRRYAFADELKREINQSALNSGGMRALFSDGLREEGGGGYYQTNGNIIPLPNWVQYEEDADMTDPLCPLGKQRSLTQWWGTQYRRSVDPDYWLDKVISRISEEQPEVALITDVRFPNEMLWCKEYGDVIKVVRPGAPPVNEHVSEKALDGVPDWEWDFMLVNDNSVEDFRERSVKMFDYLMEMDR